MARAAPYVPQASPEQPITAALWNQYQYAVGFHSHPPTALLTQNTLQSVPSASATRILFDNAIRDSDAGHSITTNPSRYTAPIPGLYHICVFGSLEGGSAGGGERSLAIVLNGGAYWVLHLLAPSSYGAGSFVGSAQVEIPMNIGDYVEASFYQDSGTTLSTSISYYQARMGIRWVGN
ncbi:hypothetical protein [Catenulispora pinisilvae]|uniref:hypothetical protein n=1 Tax=Catenulispora pinisilvae TaxID=2705253 RepID=UPI00189204DA|nr:hypothetical protein [Catenulispora pinisilvae]